jgi:hypothetical protein
MGRVKRISGTGPNKSPVGAGVRSPGTRRSTVLYLLARNAYSCVSVTALAVCGLIVAVGCERELTAPVLAIVALDPEYVLAGGPAFELRVSGSGFDPNAEVHWNRSFLQTRFLSSTRLVAQIGAANIMEPGSASLQVVSREPSLGLRFSFRSNYATFPIIPSSIELSPVEAEIPVGDMLEFVATGILESGERVRLTDCVTWSTSDPSVAEIDQSGQATAVAPGRTTITTTFSSFPSLSASTTLTVEAPAP